MVRPSAAVEEVEGPECSLSSVVGTRRCGMDHCCMVELLDEVDTAAAVEGCIEIVPVPAESAVVGSIAADHTAAGAVPERETGQGF